MDATADIPDLTPDALRGMASALVEILPDIGVRRAAAVIESRAALLRMWADDPRPFRPKARKLAGGITPVRNLTGDGE